MPRRMVPEMFLWLRAGIRKTTAFCWVSINEPIHAPRLEHDGWPLSPLFTELFTGGLKVYQGQRKLIDLPSVWTQATGNARWERDQVSEVPSRFTGVLSFSFENQQTELLIESGGYGCRGTLSQNLCLIEFQCLGLDRCALISTHPPTKTENSSQGSLQAEHSNPRQLGTSTNSCAEPTFLSIRRIG